MNDLTNFRTLAVSLALSCFILLPAHFRAIQLEKERIASINLNALIESTLIENMPDIVDCAVAYDKIANNSITTVRILGQSNHE